MENTKVVILCGGKGTRSFPFTEYFPKVMMPIDGTPIIVHLLKLFAAQGFKKFVLAAGYRQEMLKDYFEGRFSDWELDVVDTGPESDTGERIYRCRELVGDTFLATYGDGLGNVNLRHLLDTHHSRGGLATLTTVPLRSQYGLVKFDQNQRVDRFEEKPIVKDYWVNAGFFAFNKSVFEHWQGQNLEVEVLPRLAEQNLLYTHQHSGFWRSMDTSKDQQELEKIHEQHGPVWMQPVGEEPITH